MRYECGNFAGCTISVVLFVAAFNVILEYVDAGGVLGTRWVMVRRSSFFVVSWMMSVF